MRAKLAQDDQMTIEEFLAFTDTRPDEERWELIEGIAVLNPSPTNYHQMSTLNIASALLIIRTAQSASWIPLLGIGTRVPASRNSLPQPDVLVQEVGPTGAATPIADDALILFEVLSRSNTRADRAWRLKVFKSIRNCQHYVTVAQDKVQLTRYDRAAQWREEIIEGLNQVLALPAIGVSLPLAEIYRWTPLAAGH